MAVQDFTPSSEGDITKRFADLLGGDDADDGSEDAAQDQATAKAKPEPTSDDGEAEEAPSEPEQGAEDAAEDGETDEKTEAKEEDSEEVEVPGDLGTWAEQLGVEEAELADHFHVPVKIDGHATKVPLSQVVASFQQDRHWQNKNQSLAEERRSYEQERQAFNTERQQNLQVLHALAAHAEALVAGEMKALDPAKEDDDPIEYAKQERRFNQRREQLQQLYGGIQNVLYQAEAQRLQGHDQLREHHARALAERVPEWGQDIGKAQAEIRELRNWASSKFGYTQDEVNNLIDHRTILAFREHKKLEDKMKGIDTGVKLAKKKLKAIPATRPTKPGAGAGSGDVAREGARKSMRKIAKSGNYRDGEEALIRLGFV